MKKITMLMIAALVALGGMSAAAQTDNQKDNKSRTECRGKDCKEHRGGKKGHKTGKKDGFGPLMGGITLTDAQKQKVEKIRQDRREEMKRVREQGRVEVKKAGEKYDTELRSVLDADQAKVFDANKTKMQERKAAKGDRNGKMGHKGNKGHKGGKDGKFKGQKGDCCKTGCKKNSREPGCTGNSGK